MNTNKARNWIVKSSLAITGSLFLFAFIAPVGGYPLTYAQVPRIVEIILPVFLGYLGSATHFIFRANRSTEIVDDNTNSLLSLLVRGPLGIYSAATITLLVAFAFSNRQNAEPGEGMSVDQLAAGLSITLALLAATTSVLVSYLFKSNDSSMKEKK